MQHAKFLGFRSGGVEVFVLNRWKVAPYFAFSFIITADSFVTDLIYINMCLCVCFLLR